VAAQRSGVAVDAGPVEGQAAAEAISALSNLGYNPAQATAAVAAALKDLGPGVDTAQIIRRGLKELAR
jgi:Holliday junction DNA helicase RuvA